MAMIYNEDASLRADNDAEGEKSAVRLGHYTVSADALRRLEQGVDFDEMTRLVNFLAGDLKARKSQKRPVLELVFDESDFAELKAPAVEDKVVHHAVDPIELDWEDFRITPPNGFSVADIQAAFRASAGETTPNINLEVEKFGLKERLLYKDLPHETYLLLATGINLDPLMKGVEQFVQEHSEMDRDAVMSFCANVFRGLAVRAFCSMANGATVLDDKLNHYVEKNKGLIDDMMKDGTTNVEDIEAQLVAFFMVQQKMKRPVKATEELYEEFLQSSHLG